MNAKNTLKYWRISQTVVKNQTSSDLISNDFCSGLYIHTADQFQKDRSLNNGTKAYETIPKVIEEFGPVNTYPDIFENGDFFLRSKKKGGSSRSVFESFSPVQVKTLKGWKYDSIPYRACVMLVVYDVWHHAVLRYCLSTRINEKQAFLIISTLRTIFEKKRLRCPKTLFKRERKAKTEKKNLRSKKHLETCGRGLTFNWERYAGSMGSFKRELQLNFGELGLNLTF